MTNILSRKANSWLLMTAVIGLATTSGCDVIKAVAHQPTPAEQAEQRNQEFDTAMAGDTRYGPMLMKMKTTFPVDYQSLRSQIDAAIAAGASGEQLGEIKSTFLHNFSLAHTADMAAAPSENLKEVIEAQLVVISALRTSSEDECASFYNPNPKHRTHYDSVPPTAISRLALSRINAMAAGRDRPTIRTPINLHDRSIWIKEMEDEGLSQNQIAILGNPAKAAAASSHDMCAFGVVMMQSATRLPEPTADKVIAAIIRTAA